MTKEIKEEELKATTISDLTYTDTIGDRCLSIRQHLHTHRHLFIAIPTG